MRRDYESLYVLAVAFTAYAGAEMMHASGFMATFAAGLTIASTDVELCDCFRDYGEATAEMLLLFAFVAFGTALIWTGLDVMTVPGMVFALVAVLGRSAVLELALPRKGLDRESRRTIVAFGPRALSTLCWCFCPCSRASAMQRPWCLTRRCPCCCRWQCMGRCCGGSRTGSTRRSVGRSVSSVEDDDSARISLDEVAALEAAGERVRILDVRAERAWNAAETIVEGATRIDPDHPVESAAEQALPKHDWLIGYCA